jgi:hypothetical protein
MEWAGAVDVQNVFTASMSSGVGMPNEDAMDDLAAWVDDLYDVVDDIMPTQLVFVDIDFYNLTNDTPMGTLAWPTMTTGQAASNEIAASGVAAVITAFTSIVRVHGRKFFGPIVETLIDEGYLGTTVMTGMATVITKWITPFVGGTSGETWTPGVWRRATSGFAAFRDAVVRNIPGYQRRRKANVGS